MTEKHNAGCYAFRAPGDDRPQDVYATQLLDLLDEREMSKQVVETLRDLHSNWRRIIEESDADGYPLIENLLYSAIDDLGGHE